MHSKKIFDIVGIGIGPFNLGLAALCEPIEGLRCLFIDQKDAFDWHPGMMIEGSRLQVPFYADLVTLADPCSRFSYLAFLKEEKRMFQFAINEKYFITRKEYTRYCQWVAKQIYSIKFGERCKAIYYDESSGLYNVITNVQSYSARHIVIGTGTVPSIPGFAKELQHPCILHSSDYLYFKERICSKNSITITGSGQSAAEIFYDLLQCYTGKLSWFTRSARFFPMDYSKFALEMATPDYIDHFYSLDPSVKNKVLCGQDDLYKGINASLIDDIYAGLYERDPDTIHLYPNCELKGIKKDKDDSFQLKFYHSELEKEFFHDTDAVILATGYKFEVPTFIEPIKEHIKWTEQGSYYVMRNYSVDSGNKIFVQNAELHSHGFNSADLGLGPYRNSVIINSIMGSEYYAMETKVAIQNFGLPKSPAHWHTSPAPPHF